MQNDVLYNTIMKKFFIIEIESETPEGEETPTLSITKYNMKPSEVLEYGNMPLIGFCILHDVDNSYTGVIGVATFYYSNDKSLLSVFLLDGPAIDADIENDTWKIHED